MIDISIQNMGKSYFSNPIFVNVSIEIKEKDRIAIIGENGSGKTTLFKIICGDEKQSTGDLFIRKGIRVGYLKQVPDEFEADTVEDVLMTSFKKLEKLKIQMTVMESKMVNEPENSERLLSDYSNLQTRYETEGGYGIEEKLSKINEGLSFDSEFLKKSYKVLSGGEKSRVCLGKLLLEEPDVILLDEPTNHLDINSIEWLENFLKQFKGSVLMISHDRYFLDSVVQNIYELSSKGAETYNGNYSYYMKERLVRYEQRMKDYNNQQKKIKQMEDAVKRFKDWGQRGDNEAMFVKVRNMEKRINRLDKVDRPDNGGKKIKLGFESDQRSGKEVILADNAELFIGKKLLVEDINIKIFNKEKVALIGPNGCGKSTLIKTIMKMHSDYTGDVRLGSNVKYGYLEQDINFEDESTSVLESYRYEFSIQENDARHELAKFRFYGDDVFKKLNSLSGGERVRLRLAGLMRSDINLLIMDEPTNHIDIKTKEVLEEALVSFEGTLFFISHDRYFLNLLADRIIEITDCKMNTFIGGYETYKNEKDKQTKTDVEVKVENKPQKKVIEKQSKKVNPYKLNLLETEIADIELKIDNLNTDLSKLVSEYEEISELNEDINQLEVKLEKKMEEWYDLTT